MPPLLNQPCPKCGQPVTDRDQDHNVDGPMLTLTGPPDPVAYAQTTSRSKATIHMQLHWSHKVCPR